MTFLLTSHNVFDYLAEKNLGNQPEQPLPEVKLVAAKNFNLLVTFPDSRKFLVKQERHNNEGKAAGEFLSEWRIQEFLQRFPKLDHLRPFLPEVLSFDKGNTGICMLQVAKTLLCRPEQSMPTVFGTVTAELNQIVRAAA